MVLASPGRVARKATSRMLPFRSTMKMGRKFQISRFLQFSMGFRGWNVKKRKISGFPRLFVDALSWILCAALRVDEESPWETGMSPNRGDLGERGGTGGSQPCALLETAPFFSEFMKISRAHVSSPMKDRHENLQRVCPARRGKELEVRQISPLCLRLG